MWFGVLEINLILIFVCSCVPTGFCGGAYCAQNAVCQWDNVEAVSFCLCPKGYVGDGIQQCTSLPPTCHVQNNCGLNAQCLLIAPPEGYECTCNPGYHGDGINCVPDENCVNYPSMCHQNAKCVSTPAGYKCACNLGKWIANFRWRGPWFILSILLGTRRIHWQRISVWRTNSSRSRIFAVEPRSCHR